MNNYSFCILLKKGYDINEIKHNLDKSYYTLNLSKLNFEIIFLYNQNDNFFDSFYEGSLKKYSNITFFKYFRSNEYNVPYLYNLMSKICEGDIITFLPYNTFINSFYLSKLYILKPNYFITFQLLNPNANAVISIYKTDFEKSGMYNTKLPAFLYQSEFVSRLLLKNYLPRYTGINNFTWSSLEEDATDNNVKEIVSNLLDNENFYIEKHIENKDKLLIKNLQQKLNFI